MAENTNENDKGFFVKFGSEFEPVLNKVSETFGYPDKTTAARNCLKVAFNVLTISKEEFIKFLTTV